MDHYKCALCGEVILEEASSMLKGKPVHKACIQPKMGVRLSVKKDTFNPHPRDVEVQVDSEHVTLILRGPERVITLSRAELQALLDANK